MVTDKNPLGVRTGDKIVVEVEAFVRYAGQEAADITLEIPSYAGSGQIGAWPLTKVVSLKTLREGDKVRHKIKAYGNGKIIAIHGELAWVEWNNSYSTLSDLANLERI